MFNPTKVPYKTIRTYKALNKNGELEVYKAYEEEIRTVGIPILHSNKNVAEKYKNGTILYFKSGDITENDLRRENGLGYRNNY